MLPVFLILSQSLLRLLCGYPTIPKLTLLHRGPTTTLPRLSSRTGAQVHVVLFYCPHIIPSIHYHAMW